MIFPSPDFRSGEGSPFWRLSCWGKWPSGSRQAQLYKRLSEEQFWLLVLRSQQVTSLSPPPYFSKQHPNEAIIVPIATKISAACRQAWALQHLLLSFFLSLAKHLLHFHAHRGSTKAPTARSSGHWVNSFPKKGVPCCSKRLCEEVFSPTHAGFSFFI